MIFPESIPFVPIEQIIWTGTLTVKEFGDLPLPYPIRRALSPRVWDYA